MDKRKGPYRVRARYDNSMGDMVVVEEGFLISAIPKNARNLCNLKARHAALNDQGVEYYAYYNQEKRDIDVTKNIEDIVVA